ncbi:MAG: hypothetical protein C0625_07520 [Arcobacter sp.]|nr:MAG: hypothetical protein C0625_07520 [Arcobacter sp.]
MNLSVDLKVIKVGLLITLLSLIFSIGMGITFGAKEEVFKNYISKNVAMYPEVHDKKSTAKIWRYAQRAHFHAGGIASYSLALLLIILLSKMKDSYKRLSSTLIGIGTLYPFAWYSIYVMAPIIGRGAAKHHILTESIVYISVGSVIIGTVILFGSLFFNTFNEEK